MKNRLFVLVVLAVLYLTYVARSLFIAYDIEQYRRIAAIIVILYFVIYHDSGMHGLNYKHHKALYNYLAYMAISGVVSGFEVQYITLLFSSLMIYLISYMVVRYLNRDEISYVIVFYSVALVLLELAYIQSLAPVFRALRLPFLLGSAHQVAGHSALLSMPIGILFLRDSKHRLIVYGITIVLISIITIVVSAARTPLVVSSIYLLYVTKRERIVGVIFIVVALFVVYNYVDTERAITRYESMYMTIWGDVNYEENNYTFRAEHARIGFDAWIEQPIFGHGYGQWNNIRGRAIGIMGERFAAHSGIILTLAELGLVGLLLFLMMLFPMIRDGNLMRKQGWYGMLANIMGASMLAIFVVSVGGDALRSPVFFIVYGFAKAANERARVS